MNIINLNDYKKQKILEEELSRNRTSLYKSHIFNAQDDFSKRMLRIKSSLERINKLMEHVKNLEM